MTTFLRPGSTRPIDSNVFLPIIMVCPIVFFLKFFKSSGRCQGILLSHPITWLLFIATRKDIILFVSFLHKPKLYSNGRFNRRMWFVVNQFKVVQFEIKNGLFFLI